MSNTNNFVFRGLQIVAWVIFIGLCIEAGGLLVNFGFSLFKPTALPLLYQRLDLSALRAENQSAFIGIYSLLLSVALLKAYLFYILVVLTHKWDVAKPFNDFVTQQMLKISHFTLAIGLFSVLGRQSAKQLAKHGVETAQLHPFWEDGQAFILMAAVIYILASIFRKGAAIQSENELTV